MMSCEGDEETLSLCHLLPKRDTASIGAMLQNDNGTGRKEHFRDRQKHILSITTAEKHPGMLGVYVHPYANSSAVSNQVAYMPPISPDTIIGISCSILRQKLYIKYPGTARCAQIFTSSLLREHHCR